MKRPLLSPEDIARHLVHVPEWTVADGRLRREFKFADFKKAFAFMTAVAEEAEAMQHHPDWRNVWNRVSIELSTHDSGGITNLDFELAAAVDRIAAAPPTRG